MSLPCSLDKQIIHEVTRLTTKNNKDNISRTNAYFLYYKNHPDIQWSFLASMVSRNGGYNMCDLAGKYFLELLDVHLRKRLFLTYERANWLIFHDVYPQLLIYEYSTLLRRPMFHLLTNFYVSSFIQKEWMEYWKNKDGKRLMTALIINEQNVIQKPIIEHPVYKKEVFQSWLFQFEDWFHFSCVLFPTLGGELYGASVNGFRKLEKRIDLGKRLADILFHPRLFPAFYEFAEKQDHTGSRYDYEKYFSKKMEKSSPFLRATFPVIEHHLHEMDDWSKRTKSPKKILFRHVHHQHPFYLSDWYERKQIELQALVALKKLIDSKKD